MREISCASAALLAFAAALPTSAQGLAENRFLDFINAVYPGPDKDPEADVAALAEEITGTRFTNAFAWDYRARYEARIGDVDGALESLATAARLGLSPLRHLANSAAVMSRRDAHLDMVRPGLMLYGLYPDPGLRSLAELQPVMTLEACVVRLAEVGPGEGIGYGHTFRAPGRMRIATLRCGFADGYPRALSNRGVVSVGGAQARVVGRVCMDHVMIDVSHIEGLRPGDRVTMWGDGLRTEDVAERAGTIAYELVARVGGRVGRHVVG